MYETLDHSMRKAMLEGLDGYITIIVDKADDLKAGQSKTIAPFGYHNDMEIKITKDNDFNPDASVFESSWNIVMITVTQNGRVEYSQDIPVTDLYMALWDLYENGFDCSKIAWVQ